MIAAGRADAVVVGADAHVSHKDQLARFRAAVGDREHGRQLASIIGTVRDAASETYARPTRR